METAILADEARITAVKFNLANHIETNTVLGKSHGLQPVFEAIANSIDAIAESHPKFRGNITVRVIRAMDDSVQSDISEGKENHPVTGFEIEDNGIGFTDANFRSFSEGSTDYKKQRGGKGLGRFTYLKVFKTAEVSSRFLNDGRPRIRSFTFTVETANGIENAKVEDAALNQKTGTTVRLIGKNSNYKTPKKPTTIARHILEYNIAALIANENLNITLVDPDNDDCNISLRQIISDEYSKDSSVDSFDDHGHTFQLRHLLVNASVDNKANHVIFCARNFKVESHKLSSHIKQLDRPIRIDGKSYVYLGILTGSYFETNVNTTRNMILMDDDDNEDTLTLDVCRRSLMKLVSDHVLNYLRQPLKEIRTATALKVTTLIEKAAPELKAVYARNQEVLDRLTANSDDDDIYSELAVARFRERTKYQDDLRKVLSKAGSAAHLARISENLLEEFSKGSHQEATTCLIQFVVHRKSVLDLLNLYLGSTLQGVQEKEKAIHNLIFPMRRTSDDLPLEAMNLWVIDEKLAFQNYLASDLPFAQHEAIESNSRNRPDIAIYHSPHPKFWDSQFALSEQAINASAITIVEFKQPCRDNYTRLENPYEQVKKYVLDIREGKQVDRFGRTFARPKNIRFYVFVALDMTARLSTLLEENYGFHQSADGDGLFLSQPHLNLHVEVMSYQKMLEDANRRNMAYFKALGLL